MLHKRVLYLSHPKGRDRKLSVTWRDRVGGFSFTWSSAHAVSHVTAKIYFIYILKFVHETRETSSLFVLLSNIGHPTPKGCSILSIGFVTQLCCENPPCFFIKDEGNWFYNSCRRQLTCWKQTHSPLHGEQAGCLLLHRTPWPCIMHTIAWWEGGRQGPLGGYT